VIATARLVGDDGWVTAGDRWLGPADAVDERILDRCAGPVLDVGCGPGRHTVALAERGIPALGLDITRELLAVARPRGAAVLERSVFDQVPGHGRWGTALVLDANLAIGGDPQVLLRRLHQLLRPGGLVIGELVAGPAPRARGMARVEVRGRPGPWFPWVPVDEARLDLALDRHARFRRIERWEDQGRRFVMLARGP
jgi:SAM-dependent methyltransferase